MVTFNYTEEFLRQAKRLAKHYHSLADDIDALQLSPSHPPISYNSHALNALHIR